MVNALNTRLIRISVLTLLTSISAPASAGDFATCDPDLVACTGTDDTCCYKTFATTTANPIIIPLDRCHQTYRASGVFAPPDSSSPKWCADSPSSPDEGIFQAYGLAYRLMQAGIPVYWIVNPTKDPPALTASQNYASQVYTERDIDMWVLNGVSPLTSGDPLTSCVAPLCAEPIRRLDPTTLSPVMNSYTYNEFPVRGGAYMIAGEDRARFDQFWLKTGDFSGNSGNSYYDFEDVDLYEIQSTATLAYQDYRTGAASPPTNTAPVAITIDYAPPRLARLSPAGVSATWLSLVKLDQPAASSCKTGAFDPTDAVYCDITESDIQAGQLVNGDFQWAWIDNWSDNSPCGNAAEIEQHAKLDEFLTAVPGLRDGGHVMIMEAAVGVLENCPDRQFLGLVNSSVGLATHNQAPVEPLILRYPNNLFMQWGDFPTEFASGSVGKWSYFGSGSNGYDSMHTGTNGTLRRLVTEDQSGSSNTLCTNHVSTAACDVYDTRSDADIIDVAAYARHKSNTDNGVIMYAGGNQITNSQSQLRMILNAFIALPFGTVPVAGKETIVEVSRSSPVVAEVGGVVAQYQGTYELVDPVRTVTTYTDATSTFQFPYTVGHMRAVDVSSVGTTESSFDSLTAIFDVSTAASFPNVLLTGCAAPYNGSCRGVFTNDSVINSDYVYPKIAFDTANAATLGPLLAGSLTMTTTDVKTLIARILAGYEDTSGNWSPRLGGVDRSTVAVIESSSVAGSTRPTMLYFGALDGMLHAVCAEAISPCSFVGQELWAFVPRTQMPLLRQNTQRIDGSPKVSDIFGDWDRDGKKSWKTVLTFQIGSGDAGFSGQEPAVIALDITDPANPNVLWEVKTNSASRRTVDQGVGLSVTMGPIRNGATVKNLTFALTNNGGTSDSGYYLAAINTVTGAIEWEFGRTYLTPPRSDRPSPYTVTTEPPVPATAIPGGVAVYDGAGAGTITNVVIPTLYGSVYVLDALTGKNIYASSHAGDIYDGQEANPLFSFNENYHPLGSTPALYTDVSNGRLHAVVVSGGYADPINSSWAPATVDQFVISVSLEPSTNPPTFGFHETTGGDDVPIAINLGAGNRAFAQATVAGNELFVVTDSGDVNSSTYGSPGGTGALTRISLSTGLAVGSATTISGGASAVDVRNGTVFVGSADAAKKINLSNHDANGTSTELLFQAAGTTNSRVFWLSLK